MLANVLKSDQAISMSIKIIEVFTNKAHGIAWSSLPEYPLLNKNTIRIDLNLLSAQKADLI
jgi:hypothetical protein